MSANDDLATLLLGDGPVASVYLDTTSATTNPRQQIDVRWKNFRRDLEGNGADAATLQAMEAAVAEPHGGGNALALFASHGTVLQKSRWPEPPSQSFARWAPLASVGPVIEWRQSMAPMLVVRVDRVGADMVAFLADESDIEAEVTGDDLHVQRSAPGGWSQRRFQQRAENLWESNAAEVADAVVRLFDEVSARLVVVSGDVRAVQFLKEALPDRVRSVLEEVDGGREDEAEDQVAEEAVRLAATAAASDTVSLLEKFREERGQEDRAADGVPATVAALQRAQVETLLVQDDQSDDRSLWFGPEGVHLAMAPGPLTELNVTSPQEGRLVDVLIRASLAVGAEVRILPTTAADGPTDDVGAILRWAD
ncbi:MAG TPA: Vms1/Ankzf1 family peptidyl-tRNA hydrolase [Acidimicrobiales bacterium]|nr:Vms1/Ankzf1 family peptidyl-tRNA hydrolase [Acidimicrobiales bacterium]